MKQNEPFYIPESVPPKAVLNIVLIVLQAHYKRKAIILNGVLAGFDELNTTKLEEIWVTLQRKCKMDQQALIFLTQWIDGSLDGGDIPLTSED